MAKAVNLVSKLSCLCVFLGRVSQIFCSSARVRWRNVLNRSSTPFYLLLWRHCLFHSARSHVALAALLINNAPSPSDHVRNKRTCVSSLQPPEIDDYLFTYWFQCVKLGLAVQANYYFSVENFFWIWGVEMSLWREHKIYDSSK